MLSNRVYSILKYICIIAMPALITLYSVIGNTLNIPYTAEVLTIAAAVNACLGTLLGISTAVYNKRNGEGE